MIEHLDGGVERHQPGAVVLAAQRHPHPPGVRQARQFLLAAPGDQVDRAVVPDVPGQPVGAAEADPQHAGPLGALFDQRQAHTRQSTAGPARPHLRRGAGRTARWIAPVMARVSGPMWCFIDRPERA
ncbi:hypothetical protein Sru01_52050 [Sphaerisporangium rufum]|uniref:Uncharacterized protein n=1 Tax=Sphaerisporangium rufum TaxID=1381558 RepID=A0A919R6L8_9ACTN|nr:hypothetical protein Sru01_52050 [Sphaerisporangium rufum]